MEPCGGKGEPSRPAGQRMEPASLQHGESHSWQLCEGARSGTKRPGEEEARLGTARVVGLQGARRQAGNDVSLNLGRGWQTGRYTEERGVPVLCY